MKDLFLTSGSLALVLAGCGGSSTADLYLHDAPPAGVSAVKVTVASMQVHVAGTEEAKNGDPGDNSIDDDGKWESLSVNRTIDLMQHQGESAAEVLGQLSLPEGKITQLRLVLDTSGTNVATLNGTDCPLDTSKVAKKGIKINHVFKAFESKAKQKHQIYVHFDLDASLKSTMGCFELDPVLKLEHVKTDGKDDDLKMP
jgi:hypothetical protein